MREIRLSGSVGGGPQEGGCLPQWHGECDEPLSSMLSFAVLSIDHKRSAVGAPARDSRAATFAQSARNEFTHAPLC